MFVIEFSSVIL